MPKSNRSGQAGILTSEQLDALMEQFQPFGRAVFQTARFTAGRISEVFSLKCANVYDDLSSIRMALPASASLGLPD